MNSNNLLNFPTDVLENYEDYQIEQKKHLLKYVNTAGFSPLLSSFSKERYRKNKYNPLSSTFYEVMKKALVEALVQNQFELYYQPFICLNSLQTIGVEALIRWHHPQWGVIPPDKFIPIAEKNGLIIPLGEWILKRACMQMREFLSYPLKLAVNVSPYQLDDTLFLKNMVKTLRESQFPAQSLMIEITEGNYLDNNSDTRKQIINLKKMGISLALDDFGTGYAGLKYLNDFPFDVVKLDKVFVQNIVHKPKQKMIVNSVVSLVRSLDLIIHAEGIENQEDLHFIQSRGVNQAQGYFFSFPLSFDQLKSFLG